MIPPTPAHRALGAVRRVWPATCPLFPRPPPLPTAPLPAAPARRGPRGLRDRPGQAIRTLRTGSTPLSACKFTAEHKGITTENGIGIVGISNFTWQFCTDVVY